MKPPVVAFTDLKHASSTERKNLSPILDFHFSGSAIGTGGSNPLSPFRITPDASEADYFILPMHWTCYLWNEKRLLPQAMRMADLAARHSKPLIIWFKGDLVPRIPLDNYFLFLPGIVRRSQKKNHIACPAFIEDPEPKYGFSARRLRTMNGLPTVGFCGYAATSPVKTAWSIVNSTRLKLQEKLGAGDFEESPILPSTFLRSRVLRELSRSDSVKTDFVIRRSYTPSKPFASDGNHDRAVEEFYSNIYGTDYTVCMRGYGNWSYRFYQTLACGRIPVFVDTDSVLPLEDDIEWKEYCVWIDRSELPHIAEKVATFHNALSPLDFRDLQQRCRRLWEERLTLSGYVEALPDHLRIRGR